MIWLIIIGVILLVYYYDRDRDQEGFHRFPGRRPWSFPVRYDPSMYYDNTFGYYETPYIFFDKRYEDNFNNRPYWECFETNKSAGVSNSDAYKLCRQYID
jgi:hypothetical protein